MIKVFFWTEEGEAQSTNLSPQVNQLLTSRARILKKRTVDILREVFESYGQVTEVNLMNYLEMQLIKPN